MWFEVDKAGLARLLEARGKSFAVFELVQNAWDAEATTVSIEIEPIANAPYALLRVEDDSPKGWIDLSQAFTIFGQSSSAKHPDKRGRFGLGEKLVLALCRSAKIVAMSGSVIFNDSGRHRRSECRDKGTLFECEIRMTRDELQEVKDAITRLIPPTTTTFNGQLLERPRLVKTFNAKLPTEVEDDMGVLRPTVRQVMVEAYADDRGEILELGIPVCECELPWRLNVLQKVPLKFERDAVTEGFRRALQVAAVNALADDLDSEQAATPWASEALGDARILPETFEKMIVKRFGPRAVIAVPGDPVANATAAANGATLIHGGALSAGGWANLRKHNRIPTSSQAFPTPKPAPVPESDLPEAPKFCPLCNQVLHSR